jgi:site-specific recombinase XerD
LTLDVATYLEEYLEVWRPKLPNAAKDRHVFLSKRGRPFTDTTLRNRLRINVYRYTKKHLYTHLLRTIFTSQALSDGEDINTVAYGLNDTPATVLRAYNELSPVKHQRAILERVRRLAKRTHSESKGHGNASAISQ